MLVTSIATFLSITNNKHIFLPRLPPENILVSVRERDRSVWALSLDLRPWGHMYPCERRKLSMIPHRDLDLNSGLVSANWPVIYYYSWFSHEHCRDSTPTTPRSSPMGSSPPTPHPGVICWDIAIKESCFVPGSSLNKSSGLVFCQQGHWCALSELINRSAWSGDQSIYWITPLSWTFPWICSTTRHYSRCENIFDPLCERLCRQFFNNYYT